jgi:pimeloyl-ACP methyl ester carboxylesterase
MARTETVALAGGVRLVTRVEGDAPTVVLLPSADRGADDFAQLAGDLAVAGYGSVALNPRGIGGSEGPTEGLTLADLAGDVAGAIDALVGRPAHVVGHALGNTIARAAAAYRPDAVRSLALLACGGHDMGRTAPPPAVMEAFGRIEDATLPEADRLAALRVVFFAEGNDPTPWLGGWWHTGRAISGALATSNWEEWYLGGEAPVLIVQPTEDAMAPPPVGRALAAAMGERARYVEVAHCGHAILPEQPEIVAATLVGYLRAVEAGAGGTAAR